MKLEVREVSVNSGSLRAVDRVSFEAESGKILGIVGPNGSGKSTLSALTGLVGATGRVTLDGRFMDHSSQREVRKAGIVRLFQSPQVYDALSCIDDVRLSTSRRRNVGLGGALCWRRAMHRTELARIEIARRALDDVGLEGYEDRPVSRLTFGERRLLELARSIAAEPIVLMLDEPSAGLNGRGN